MPGALEICPVHGLRRVLAEREQLGLGPKHPLFPRKDGRATTSRAVCASYRMLLHVMVTEHSFRREGAQFYARHGVQEGIIQFLGCWGGATVKRYIGEALDSQASCDALSAVSNPMRPTVPGTLADGTFRLSDELLKQLKGPSQAVDAEAIVERAVEAARRTIEEMQVAQEAKWAQAAEDRLGAVMRVGGTSEQEQVHRIVMGDGCVPPSLWTTWCGWRFGLSGHVRVKVGLISCKKCLRHA